MVLTCLLDEEIFEFEEIDRRKRPMNVTKMFSHPNFVAKNLKKYNFFPPKIAESIIKMLLMRKEKNQMNIEHIYLKRVEYYKKVVLEAANILDFRALKKFLKTKTGTILNSEIEDIRSLRSTIR